MFWRGILGPSVAIGGILATARAQDMNAEDCPEGFEIIELHPVEIIYPGPPPSTSTTTFIRTLTVFPEDMPDWVTITSEGPSSTTITVPPMGTEPGTIIIVTPPGLTQEPPTVTTTEAGETPTTITVPGTGTIPGTVIIVTPPAETPGSPGTVTTTIPGPAPTTITIPGTGTVPGTIIIVEPTTSDSGVPSTVTITSSGPTPTTQTVPGTGTVPGTVIIITPEPTPTPTTATITTPWTGFEERTLTSSGTVVVETPACSAGFQWAYYSRDAGTGVGQIPRHENADAETYPFSVFNIGRSINGQDPDLEGDTTTFGVGPYTEDPAFVYGVNTNNPRDNMIVQHLGYFRPIQAGDYTFTVEPEPNGWSPIDDTLYLWFNDLAVDGYDNNNAVMVADAFLPDRGQLEYTYTVSEADVGTYIPFRFLFLNAQGFGTFNFAVRNPGGGDPIVSRDTPNTDGQFVCLCDSEVAPALEWNPPSPPPEIN